jgi:hypothetical protein
MSSCDGARVESLGRSDELLDRFLALEPNTLELLWWPQEWPLAINEAEHRNHWRRWLQPRGGDGLHNSLNLPAHVLGQMRAVTTTHEEPFVGLEEPTDITDLDQSAIELGIDHEDSSWSNQKVIDISPGAWNSAIVERFEFGDISESLGKLLFSFSPLSPCAR